MFPDYDDELYLPIVRDVSDRLQKSSDENVRMLGKLMRQYENTVALSLQRGLEENLMHVVFDISALPPNKDGSRG